MIDEDGATIDPGTTLDAGTAVRLSVSKGPATPPSTLDPTDSATPSQ